MSKLVWSGGASPIPFLPLLRPGDSAHTAIALNFLTLSQGSYQRSANTFLPGVGRADKRRVERGCRAFASAAFGDAEQAARVLYENTLFGVLCRGLSTDAQATIASVLISGPQLNEPSWLLRSFTARMKSTWTPNHRSCPECVQEDLDERGYAAWKVLHELAQVDRCVYHGCALQPDLPVSGTSPTLTYYNRLPRNARCGSRYDTATVKVPRSAGCNRYLQGWLRAFEGKTPVLAVDKWMSAVARAIAVTGSRSELHSVLELHLIREWECTLGDVAAWLKIRSGRDFLARELALATHPGCLAQRIVVLGALETAGLIVDRLQPQTEFRFSERTPEEPGITPDRSPLHAFCKVVLDAGYPPTLVAALESGCSMTEMVKVLGADSHANLIAAIPDELLARLLDCNVWSEKSWIRYAIRSRRVGKGPRAQSESRHRMFDQLLQDARETARN